MTTEKEKISRKMTAEIIAKRESLHQCNVKPLTYKEKMGLAMAWFAEDWAIENAIGMLTDYETFQEIKGKNND